MTREKAIVGFIGAGGIARSHAYSLNSLKYYYEDAPFIELNVVCSARTDSRESFCKRFGFKRSSDLNVFITDKRTDTVFILGPNKVHFQHLRAVIGMASLKRIYIEKPVCSNQEEEIAIVNLLKDKPEIKIQVGFQYLFSPAVREALVLWRTGILGKPLHFELKYYHSDYLQNEYRNRRRTRLTPAPDGGAMADLGSHIISLLIAFMGKRLSISSALQGGHFDDVDEESDLFSHVSLYDSITGAVGTLASSRISSGTGDMITMEFFCEKGSLKYSSLTPDYFEYYLEETGLWERQIVGSNYRPLTSFPSGHVPPGWLRSMIHAHYVFLTGNDKKAFIPDIEHGLAVQRLVTETAEQMKAFRKFKT
jgi:predicted dehydrogenase